MRKNVKRWVAAVGFTIWVLSAIACGSGGLSEKTKEVLADGEARKALAGEWKLANPDKMAKFNRIVEGMTSDEVCAILGSQGKVMASGRTTSGGTYSEVVWDIGEADVWVTFTDGRVEGKTDLQVDTSYMRPSYLGAPPTTKSAK
jgi:hypothetical protein